jgi:cellulose biosynthesis protein BcsQ
MESWKTRKLENQKAGKMDSWKTGFLESWKAGKPGRWIPGKLENHTILFAFNKFNKYNINIYMSYIEFGAFMAAKIICLAGTKGGILKSTLTQCIATSAVFEPYKVAILEGDSQGSLQAWIEERSSVLKPLKIDVINHDEVAQLKDEMLALKHKYDFIFVDLPGESKALTLTRTALAYADLCIFPLRLSHKDTTAFDTNMRQPLMNIIKLRGARHFKILPIFAHHSTNLEAFRQNYASIAIIDKFENIHKDRTIYTYFSVGGLTLREYEATHKLNPSEAQKTAKAVHEMELIAAETLQILNAMSN